MKFSIIIPVHNRAEYLVKCLTSWQKQTYTNFEVICVENGSTDGSLGILRRFAQCDKRFRVYHTDIVGVSYARNLGMKNISGDFLGFCDSDDYVHSNYLENAIKLFESYDADCVITGMKSVSRDEAVCVGESRHKETLYSSQDVLCKIVCNRKIGPFACNKLFKVSSVKMVPWDETVTYTEDLLWNAEMFYKNQLRVVHSTQIFYFYVQYPDSITHTPAYIYDEQGIFKQILALEKMKSYYAGEEKTEKAWISEFCFSKMENVYLNPDLSRNIKRDYMQYFWKNCRLYFGNTDRSMVEKMKTVVKLLIIYARRM